MIDLSSYRRLLDQNVKQHMSKIIDLVQNVYVSYQILVNLCIHFPSVFKNMKSSRISLILNS